LTQQLVALHGAHLIKPNFSNCQYIKILVLGAI